MIIEANYAVQAKYANRSNSKAQVVLAVEVKGAVGPDSSSRIFGIDSSGFINIFKSNTPELNPNKYLNQRGYYFPESQPQRMAAPRMRGRYELLSEEGLSPPQLPWNNE